MQSNCNELLSKLTTELEIFIKAVFAYVYFRWNSYQPAAPAQFFMELLSENKIVFENTFTVIDTDCIRQKKY
jgi:hypothetical protein